VAVTVLRSELGGGRERLEDPLAVRLADRQGLGPREPGDDLALLRRRLRVGITAVEQVARPVAKPA
jgi:hypothetical protein